jgi:hypothetical protein
MRPPHHILDRRQVHRLAAEHLQSHLESEDYKRRASAQVLWAMLLAAAARITSPSDACQRLRDATSERKALSGEAPPLAFQQKSIYLVNLSHVGKIILLDAFAFRSGRFIR